MKKSVMTVFVDEIRVETHDPHKVGSIKHSLPYEVAIASAYEAINNMNYIVTQEYSEVNEFDDPVTCIYIERN